MLDYIKNILPRIQQYSKSLDRKELFVDKKWVMMDEEGNKFSHEFLRDGRLFTTVGKNSTQSAIKGIWELLSSGRLHIELGGIVTIYESAFFSEGVMILKVADTDLIPFILYDPLLIKDLEEYFDKLTKAGETPELTPGIKEILSYGSDEGWGSKEYLIIMFVFFVVGLIILLAVFSK